MPCIPEPPFYGPSREAYRKEQEKIKRLIDAARAGNGERLARYIEGSHHHSFDWFNKELRAFLAELVRKAKKEPRPDQKKTGRPQSYAAFHRNRRIAWFVAKCLLSDYRPDGKLTEKAIKQALEGTKLKLTERANKRACDSGEFGTLDRRTVQDAWKNNPDLHDPLTVEMLLSLGPSDWRREHLT
jgi:hypothetical protein